MQQLRPPLLRHLAWPAVATVANTLATTMFQRGVCFMPRSRTTAKLFVKGECTRASVGAIQKARGSTWTQANSRDPRAATDEMMLQGTSHELRTDSMLLCDQQRQNCSRPWCLPLCIIHVSVSCVVHWLIYVPPVPWMPRAVGDTNSIEKSRTCQWYTRMRPRSPLFVL